MNTHKLLKAFFFVLLSTAWAGPAQSGNDLEQVKAAISTKDYAKAIHRLRPLAEQGNAVAQNAVGVLYYQGWGVTRDLNEALKWFRKAADQEDPKAQYYIGAMYAGGIGVGTDGPEAAKWFRASADLGYAPAQIELGRLYGRGDGVPQNYAEALRWYRKAAEQGDPDAQWRVGLMYMRGESVHKDNGEAEKWFRKAASQKHAFGYFWLGHLYLTGLGVGKDMSEAIKWFALSADELRAKGVPAFEIGNKKDQTQEEQASLRLLNTLRGAKTSSAVMLLEQALQAPAADLAQSYQWVKEIIASLPLAESGGAIHTPSGTIRSGNVTAVKAEMEDRLSVYGAAITQRGYKTIAGTYHANVTSSCGRTQSFWTGGIRQGLLGDINISQDGFKVHILHRYKIDGKSSNLEMPGVIAESALTFTDPMNSDFVFLGEVAAKEITVRPHVEKMLAASPNWVKPPSRSDLTTCSVTLVPTHTGDVK
jgi:TPR repeat protein